MARNCVIGKGFIASALIKRLDEVGFYPTPDTQTVFYLDSVTHPDFEKNPEYHLNKVIQDFLGILPYCRTHSIRFIYASSAMVYEKDTQFTKCKRALELIAQSFPHTLALRIFPVYGLGEERTVISKWCKEMKEGKQPTIYGDGTQTRDFIYIDDVVDQILFVAGANMEGVADIGAGTPTSFNEIIGLINKELGTNIQPIYREAPKDYSKGIHCKLPLEIKVPLAGGIKKICQSMQ